MLRPCALPFTQAGHIKALRSVDSVTEWVLDECELI